MVSKYRAAVEATVKSLQSVASNHRQSDVRTGRDGRVINTANIRRAARRRTRGKPRISRKAFKPVRTGRQPAPMTALNMPHDPVMGARTLIELFDADYLGALVEFLTTHLKGADA